MSVKENMNTENKRDLQCQSFHMKDQVVCICFLQCMNTSCKRTKQTPILCRIPCRCFKYIMTGTLWRCRAQKASGMVFWRDLTDTDGILQLKPGTYYFDFKGMAQWVTLHHTCRISEVLPMHGIGEYMWFTPVKYCEGRLLGSQGLAGFRYLKFWTSIETKLCRGSK